SWRSSPPAIRLVLVFAVLWYFMHELSPMKPFMAIERHMTVMGGLFAVSPSTSSSVFASGRRAHGAQR
ncbi:MAG TPA: hypothetical protein VNC81_08570, partial [Xanthobacteraceae bacterium]|nr:hypothetical protein [Xanthobacteraceae bacterium]